MNFCFFCMDKNIQNDIVLNDSITDISEELEGTKPVYFYSDDEVEDYDYEKHIVNLNLKTMYENTEKLTLLFMTTVGYSIFLAIIYKLINI